MCEQFSIVITNHNTIGKGFFFQVLEVNLYSVKGKLMCPPYSSISNLLRGYQEAVLMLKV